MRLRGYVGVGRGPFRVGARVPLGVAVVGGLLWMLLERGL
jgi:hypothetical protein